MHQNEELNFFSIFWVFSLCIVISCNNTPVQDTPKASSAPDLTGRWNSAKSSAMFLDITKTGETYSLWFHTADPSNRGVRAAGKYNNGVIETGGGPYGNPVYSEDTKRISWMSDEWTKANSN